MFAKTLLRHEPYLSANCKLCRKLVSLVPVMFDGKFRVAAVVVFTADFSFLSWEFDNFTFHCYIYDFIVSCEKFSIASLTSSIMKNITIFPAHSRFPVKLISCDASGSASSGWCLLRPIAVNIYFLTFNSVFRRKYIICSIVTALSSSDNTKSIFTPWKL